MRSARIHEHGGPSVIRIDDVPVPVPGEGEVLVRMAATSFNPTEIAVREGRFPVALPHTLGWDVAGTVDGRAVVGWVEGPPRSTSSRRRTAWSTRPRASRWPTPPRCRWPG
ncbi:alcohol dehydrogenase catalytic domain-containing protein [Saccharothrix sp.]|uniref:alcohol dehydrogenase catalytic domain-containing protein n=1 Tax=Saccharothrix sp. TaxID=1873460 RepID=UPI002810B57B|nr:alcohol dehydrogenase catalytic domain-containing protein [Saccharothrix sp.]